MAEWTRDEIARIGSAEEVRVAGRRPDGTLRPPVTIWAVPHKGNLYVRSVRGRDGGWYKGIEQMHEGHIEGGGVRKDVTFTADPAPSDEIDMEYRAKYQRYAGRILNSILTPAARATTTRVMPR